MRAPAFLLFFLLAVPAHADESPAAYSAVPIPAGQVAMAVGKVDELVADAMSRTGVPGMAVAVVQGGGGELHEDLALSWLGTWNILELKAR